MCGQIKAMNHNSPTTDGNGSIYGTWEKNSTYDSHHFDRCCTYIPAIGHKIHELFSDYFCGELHVLNIMYNHLLSSSGRVKRWLLQL